MINFKSIRNNAKKYSDIYGYVISFVLSIALVLYCYVHSQELYKQKESGHGAISINLAAFAPPTDLPIEKQLHHKHKRKHNKKQKDKIVKTPLKKEPTLLQASQEEKQEEKSKDDSKEQDSKESAIAPNTNANSDTNIKVLSSANGVDDPYLQAVRSEVEKYNKYPRGAFNRRLTGEVTIKFLIKLNGDVDDIELLSSSKYDILDKAALSALDRAKRHFPKPVETVYIVIPINYALQIE